MYYKGNRLLDDLRHRDIHQYLNLRGCRALVRVMGVKVRWTSHPVIVPIRDSGI